MTYVFSYSEGRRLLAAGAFLANENLADQVKSLLEKQLEISTSVVESVGDFVDGYLEQVWVYRHTARPRQRRLSHLEAAARMAIVGLSDHHKPGRLWEVYERQMAERLAAAASSDWKTCDIGSVAELNASAGALERVGAGAATGRDPLKSRLTLEANTDRDDRVYGAEDRPWLAWLLRFALPEATDPQARFPRDTLLDRARDDRRRALDARRGRRGPRPLCHRDITAGLARPSGRRAHGLSRFSTDRESRSRHENLGRAKRRQLASRRSRRAYLPFRP